MRRVLRSPTAGVAVGLVIGLLVAAVAVPRRQERVTVARSSGGTGSESALGVTAAPGSTPASGVTTPAGDAPAGASPGASSGADVTSAPGVTAGTSDGSAASTATVGTPPAAPAGGGSSPVRGVTGTTVKIGIAVLDLSAVKFLGPEYDNGDVPGQWQALLDRWHHDHVLPVNGRDVQFVFRTYSVTSADQQRSACASLVQDDKVFAVVALEFFYQQGAECVAREFRTPLLTSEGPTETVFARSAPYLFSLTLSTTRLLRNWVLWADRRGFLRGHRIGVYHLDDPTEQQVVDDGIKTELARLGYRVAAEATTANSLGGPEDALAVQKFRASGVDLAMVLTSKGGFTQQAEAQGYHPTYIDSDYNGGTSDVGTNQYVAAQFNGSLAMTTVRRGEPAAGIAPSPEMEPCVRNYEQRSGHTVARPGPGGHESAEWVFVVLSCDEGKVLLAALRAAGPDLTPTSFVAGLESLRDVPLIRYPDVSFGPGRHEGVDQQRTLQWHGDCTCWKAMGEFGGLYSQ